MTDPINKHGDKLVENQGKGSDIASQRMDDLDTISMEFAHDRLELGGDVLAMDAGCGRCGMANRYAELGLEVDAVDLGDFASNAKAGVHYFQQDLVEFLQGTERAYDLILCQRTIHYLPYERARQLIRLFAEHLKPGARLFISASGITTELADGYAAANQPVSERHDHLAPAMQEKHGIRDKVCLYSLDELSEALEAEGFTILQAFESEFGNVKIEATRT